MVVEKNIRKFLNQYGNAVYWRRVWGLVRQRFSARHSRTIALIYFIIAQNIWAKRALITLCSLFIILPLLWLPSCSSDDNLTGIRAYIASINKRPAVPIEPLPVVKPYKGIVYSATGLRSPFIAPITTLQVGTGFGPDLKRVREPLEKFPLDSLRMLGSLTLHGEMFGIIVDKEGMAHRVRIGDYMGQNFGQIKTVFADRLELTETIPDGHGGWKPRDTTLMMGQ